MKESAEELAARLRTKKTLDTWVIYWNPDDHPGKYVVRLYWADPTGLYAAKVPTITATLEETRAVIPKGLTRVDRSPVNAPAIVETWM